MNSYLERLRHELEEATENASISDLAKGPAGKWSPAQILEHLALTYKNTNRGLEKCLARNAALAGKPTLKDRFATMLVVGLGYIPEGRKAPDRVVPHGLPSEEVRNLLTIELQTMSMHLDDCERRFGERTKLLDHPFLGPLTANEWRKFHWVHGRHHARQMRERMLKS